MIQSQSDSWLADSSKPSAKLRDLSKLGVDKWTRSELLEGTIALGALSEVGKPVEIRTVLATLARWNSFETLDFVEYRWTTYLYALSLPGPELLTPLKKLDLAVPDNYLTQRYIILQSGARVQDIEYGLALGKRFAERWKEYPGAQMTYGMILWDKARKSRKPTDFDAAIDQCLKAKKCASCPDEYRVTVDKWVERIKLSKARDARN